MQFAEDHTAKVCPYMSRSSFCVRLLTSLGCALQALSVLLKSLAGAIPWCTYIKLLDNTHKAAKDHATAIETARYIQQLVSGVSAGQTALLLTRFSIMVLSWTPAQHESSSGMAAAAAALQAHCVLHSCLEIPVLSLRWCVVHPAACSDQALPLKQLHQV